MSKPASRSAGRQGLFPDRMFAKLQFVERTSSEIKTGVSDIYQWRGNSLWDPDKTSTGHQPMGFDQYAGIYNYYRVYSSKISIKYANAATVAAEATTLCYVWPSLNDNTTPVAISDDHYLEQPYVKQSGGFNSSGSYPGARGVSNYMSTRKIYGEDKSVAADDNFQAGVTTNPVNQWFWNVTFAPMYYASVTSTTIYSMVRIEYFVEFSGRKQLAGSS